MTEKTRQDIVVLAITCILAVGGIIFLAGCEVPTGPSFDLSGDASVTYFESNTQTEGDVTTTYAPCNGCTDSGLDDTSDQCWSIPSGTPLKCSDCELGVTCTDVEPEG